MTRRKDGRWIKKVTIDGKQKSFYSSEPTEAKAEKDIIRQMVAYQNRVTGGVPFSEVADEWFEQSDVAVTTKHRYSSYKERAKEWFGDTPVNEIAPRDVEELYQDMARKQFASKTIRGQASVVSLIFQYARVYYNLHLNPSDGITPAKGKKSTHREALTEEEQKIVEYSVDKTFGLFAYLILFTGLRKSEALGLRYEDIDREKKRIEVSRAVVFAGNKPVVKTTKTEAGTRTVILLDKLDKVLPKKKKGYVFFPDEPKGQSWVADRWRAYQAETGLNITAYQLRHTYATILFEADINEKDTCELMGHSSIEVTRNIYQHIRERKLQMTADKLNRALNEQEPN